MYHSSQWRRIYSADLVNTKINSLEDGRAISRTGKGLIENDQIKQKIEIGIS